MFCGIMCGTNVWLQGEEKWREREIERERKKERERDRDDRWDTKRAGSAGPQFCSQVHGRISPQKDWQDSSFFYIYVLLFVFAEQGTTLCDLPLRAEHMQIWCIQQQTSCSGFYNHKESCSGFESDWIKNTEPHSWILRRACIKKVQQTFAITRNLLQLHWILNPILLWMYEIFKEFQPLHCKKHLCTEFIHS